jgi:hypothetical protein
MQFLVKDMQAFVPMNCLYIEDCNVCIRDEVGDILCICHEACEECNITLAAGYAFDRSSCSEK